MVQNGTTVNGGEVPPLCGERGEAKKNYIYIDAHTHGSIPCIEQACIVNCSIRDAFPCLFSTMTIISLLLCVPCIYLPTYLSIYLYIGREIYIYI